MSMPSSVSLDPLLNSPNKVLRLLTEEPRAIHRERANASRSPVAFAVGNLVMAKVQVNSDAATGAVAKLAHRKRGPYEIIESTGFGAYMVRRHGYPDSPLLKHPTQALSPLPPPLLPCTLLDTPDFNPPAEIPIWHSNVQQHVVSFCFTYRPSTSVSIS
jgi:hypothetical protein